MADVLESSTSVGVTTPTANVDQVVEKQEVSAIKLAKHFGQDVRIGSRKIQLKVILSHFSMLPKGEAAKPLRDEVIKKVGSSWKRGTKSIVRGLSQEEERYYLPTILGISPNSEQWNAKTLEYWANFSIEVPGTPEGIEFEAGFKLEDGKTVPIDLDGYINYNFCRQTSSVANENEDNLITYVFQMFDKAKDQLNKEKLYALRKQLDGKFLNLVRSTDPNQRAKIDWILETNGGSLGVGMNVIGMTDVEKEMALEEIKDKNIGLFQSLIEDPDLEIKALLRKGITIGQLSLEGATYFLGNKAIGNIGATISYFKDKANIKDRLSLVERIRDAAI